MDLGIETIKCEYCPVRHRWRLVEYELPQKEGHYLVTIEANGIREVKIAHYFEDSAYWSEYVVAWMPLPEVA